MLVAQDTNDLTDGQLLERFAKHREEAAFAALLQRHGPLVLGVCRRVLHHEHDAEDAFQATFLVLARKAQSIRKQNSVGSWLHGVAYRIAMKAKANAAKRHVYESRAMNRTPPDPLADVTWQELRMLLDQELQWLPAKCRTPVLLCDLQGKTQEEAAQQLGWRRGTLKRRLERGRELLRTRLTRRGVTLSAGLFASLLTPNGTTATVPATLIHATLKAGLSFATGETAGVATVQAVSLAEGVLKIMALTKLKTAAVLLLAVTAAGAGWAICTRPAPAETPSVAAPPLAVKPAPQDNKLIAAVKPAPNDEKPALVDLLGDALPHGALARLGTVRFRHGAEITCLVYSADGKTLISGSFDNTIRVWDVATGRELRRFTGHHQVVGSVALSSDGTVLASGGNDNEIHLWDMTTGRQLHCLKVFPTGGIRVAFSPDGKTLASAGGTKAIVLWDVKTGQELKQFRGHEGLTTCVAFSPDGNNLVSGNADKSIRLWDVATGKELWNFGTIGQAFTLAFSRDGKKLAAGGEHTIIRLWDVETGREQRPLAGHSLAVSAVTFSPDGKTLLSTSWDGTLRTWNVSTGEPIHRQKGMGPATFSPDGKTWATTGGNLIRFWDAASSKEYPAFGGHTGRVTTLAFSLDNKTLATGSQDNTIRFWETATGKELRTLRGHTFGINAVVFSGDGKLLASGGSDYQGVLRLWDVAGGIELTQLQGHQDAVLGLACSPDGKTLASCGKGSIRLWDLEPKRGWHPRRQGQLGSAKEYYYSVAFSPDGKTLASGKQKGIELWDLRTHRVVLQWGLFTREEEVIRSDHPETSRYVDGVYSLCFSPDGKTLVSGSRVAFNLREFAAKEIRLWDVATGKERQRFTGHRGEINATAFSPDGKTLASASADGTIRLWEMATGKERGRFTGHQGLVNALVFSSDGRLLASASEDTTVLVWDVTGLTKQSTGQP
jgi:RNA polymerase sigma factor (sigma-70 family)